MFLHWRFKSNLMKPWRTLHAFTSVTLSLSTPSTLIFDTELTCIDSLLNDINMSFVLQGLSHISPSSLDHRATTLTDSSSLGAQQAVHYLTSGAIIDTCIHYLHGGHSIFKLSMWTTNNLGLLTVPWGMPLFWASGLWKPFRDPNLLHVFNYANSSDIWNEIRVPVFRFCFPIRKEFETVYLN